MSIYHVVIYNNWGRVIARDNVYAESAMGAREEASFRYGAEFRNIQAIPAGEMV